MDQTQDHTPAAARSSGWPQWRPTASRARPRPAGRARDSVTTVKAALDAERKALDKAIFALLKSDDAWDGKPGVLTSVPGVGATTAATRLAEMPALGTLSRRTVASPAGLAPFDHDSGTLGGRRFVRGGRTAVPRRPAHGHAHGHPPERADPGHVPAAAGGRQAVHGRRGRLHPAAADDLERDGGKNNRHWTPQPA